MPGFWFMSWYDVSVGPNLAAYNHVRKTAKPEIGNQQYAVIAPTLLAACCLCGKIRDETGSSPDHEHWVTQRTYRQTHGVKLANVPLTHTYCPTCFTKFMATLRQYRREIGPSP